MGWTLYFNSIPEVLFRDFFKDRLFSKLLFKDTHLNMLVTIIIIEIISTNNSTYVSDTILRALALPI